MAPIVMIAGFKGGTGKSSIAHHLAARADERGLRVVALDTDPQGDLYRRLLGDAANLVDAAHAAWGRGSLAAHTPGAYALPPTAAEYDLVIVDTAPGEAPLDGPVPTILLVPIDSVDAARNARVTVQWASAAGVPATVLVLNGVDEGGKRHARQFAKLYDNLPAGVQIARVEVPRGGSIKRAASDCRPAWRDLWPGKDAEALRSLCDGLLDILAKLPVPSLPRAPAPATTRATTRASAPTPPPRARRTGASRG